MAATKQNPIVFYDIVSKFGPWSPNTWKTKIALNYKRIPYRVEFVSYPDIEPLFKKLGVPPTPNSNPPCTLPMIADPSSDPNEKPTYVVDSFKIALYLDDKYPSPQYPTLFPPGTRGFHSLFTETFVKLHEPLRPTLLPMVGRPGFLDDRGHEYFQRTRHKRFGKSLARLAEEDGPRTWAEGPKVWGAFKEHLDKNGGGPFVMGEQISYADLMLGALFYWVRITEPGDEKKLWKDISTWQDGRWARLWAEVEPYTQNSSEV
ncbi:glutathione S-transferase [Ceratobasidium sp. AG-Ba]|nr:glutathione S-transferase [Ceratobasidium sp. AG-Ba]QRW04172.1 glutathione S-transferase [Ceratobasidium sp. AG-Ba]